MSHVQVHPNRVVEDEAVNRFTTLMQRNRHIVDKIDLRNDFGEDLHVRFVVDGIIPGDTISVQAKGGETNRAAGWIRVPMTDHHRRSWSTSNLPVVCVAHDPVTAELYWANATAQLAMDPNVKSIRVPFDAPLNEETLPHFVDRMRRYIAQRGTMETALGLVAQPLRPLSAKIERSVNGGIVALYYRGQFAPYTPLSNTENPIHIRSSQHGRIVDFMANSIRSASSTLDLSDFEYRIFETETDYRQLASQWLTDCFRPIWSAGGPGRGIDLHSPGHVRYSKRSAWDTLHPGRPRTPQAVGHLKASSEIIADIRDHFAEHPPKTSEKQIIDDILGDALR